MDDIIRVLKTQLVESYRSIGGINHLDGKNLPSKRSIDGIAHNLLRLLFPGFFDEEPIHSSDVERYTSNLLATIIQDLEPEIQKSIEYMPPDGLPAREVPAYARKVTVDFLRSLPEVRELLSTDVEAAYNGDPAALSKEEVILAYPFVECIAIQRMAHRLYKMQVPLIPRMLTEWAHARTGMDLHPGAEIGAYFFVDHCTGTVVGETTVIGNHVKMYQGVGLVARSLAAGRQLRGQKRHPTIEDHVTIYAGATIVGGETVIGAHSTIGANVFLTHSVPPYSLVLTEGETVRVYNKQSKAKAGQGQKPKPEI